MRVLISAYACEPNRGSEPGAGYALVRAASDVAECWVLTRTNNVVPLRDALANHPTRHPVHLVPVDAHPAVLWAKRRLGAVRPYYMLWQRLARRVAIDLDEEIDFDLIHHATMSSFWLPIGVLGMAKPIVVGPVSGGTLTPRSMLVYLGARGIALDAARWAISRLAGIVMGAQWRRSVSVLLAQNEEMRAYAEKVLAGAGTKIVVHSHASNPPLQTCTGVTHRTREVLFVGRLLTWKGVLLALESFATAKVADARLVFIGDGEARRLLSKRIRELGLEDCVDFAGALPRDEVLRRMCAAAALLFPSFHDSAGFVVSEALSLGLPVVCLDHGGPGYLRTLWPETPAAAVGVGPRPAVLNEMARAIREFVVNPAPVLDSPTQASIDISDVIALSYRTAIGEHCV